MKCVIIDDEELPRVVLGELINKLPNLEVVASFQKPLDALKFLNQNDDIGLIFLDVSMPQFSGFEFMQALSRVPAIILVTAYRDHAVTAFEYDNVVDFLVKPVALDRLKKAARKAEQYFQKAQVLKNELNKYPQRNTEGQDLYIQNDKKLIKIAIPEIQVIQAKGNYILIKTHAGNYITYSSLKNIENKLPRETFVRIHRSYLINFTKIVDIKDSSVLIGKEIIPVSRRYKPNLLERLNKL